jgi:hypothetical protein
MAIITSVHIQEALSAFSSCQLYNERDNSESKTSPHRENWSKSLQAFPVIMYKLSFGAHCHQSKVKEILMLI